MGADGARELGAIGRTVHACRRCPRLVEHRERVAATRRRAYATQTYWGRPVGGFGDPAARLVLVGLAPAAHGANRTGRMFTGDRSGDFLVAALFRAGFASQAQSRSADDGLRLLDAYVTAVVRCAPPDNRPLPAEIAACRTFLATELDALASARVVLALGRVAWDGLAALRRERGLAPVGTAFGHGARAVLPEGRVLLGAYHPSQQNTQTGRLTAPMMDAVLAQARADLSAAAR